MLGSLTKKAIFSIAGILLPILIAFLISYKSNKAYVERFMIDALTVVAEAYEGQVYQFLEMSKRRADDFASDGFLRDTLNRIINGDKEAVHQLNDHLSRNKMSLDKTIYLIQILTMDGRVVASSNTTEIGMDVADSDFFKNAKKGQMITENLSKHEGKPTITLSSAITDRVTGEQTGYIVNFILLHEISRVLTGEFNKELGSISWDKGRPKTMEAYLVNRDKLMLTQSIFITDSVMKQQVDTMPVNACLRSNIESSGFYKDYRGVEVAGVSMCFPSLQWTLLVEVDKYEVLFSVKRIKTMASAGFLGFVLFSSALIGLFLRNVVKPLRGLTSASDEIALGHYDVTVPVTGSDEIGTLSASFNTMVRELDTKTSELKKLSTMIEHSNNIIFITDRKGIIEYVNPMFERVTGWSKDEVLGQSSEILGSEDTSKVDYYELLGTITAGKTWRGSLNNRKKAGQAFYTTAVITPITNERGEITNFLTIEEDVTERMAVESRVRYLEHYSAITGLFNRGKFLEQLSEWINNNPFHDGARGIILLLNIDEFKLINDTYGHGVGDELLRRISILLKNTLESTATMDAVKRESFFMGHMGGDEFAVFIPNSGAIEGIAVCDILRKGVEGISLKESPVQVTMCTGIVVYPEHGLTKTELITKANAALSHAKMKGGNRCHIYCPEDHDIEKAQSRIKEKERIQMAIREDRFVPWFQPILDLRDNRVHHYEALARMQGEGGKILFPSEFIDTAERFGMIGAIDRIITEKTMRLQAGTGRNGRHYSFAMNLSGKNLGDEELLSFLQSKIRETGADANQLIFEITETAAVQDLDKAVKFIAALKAMGCKFSLDDFGVGFTSFVYLREMQVDYIKIDGSFVRRMHENQEDQFIVKAIIGVAQGMGIKTVAEFVEKEEILRFLKEYGVDYAQGYFIGKPGPNLLPD